MSIFKYGLTALMALGFAQFASAVTVQGANILFTGSGITNLQYASLMPGGDWTGLSQVPDGPQFIEATNSGGKQQVVMTFYVDGAAIDEAVLSGEGCSNVGAGSENAVVPASYNNVTMQVTSMPTINDNPRIVYIKCIKN